MKNKISDLNDHLFEQLERLNDDELSEAQLEMELKRSKSMTAIAASIIDGAQVRIEAMKLMEKAGADITKAGENILQIGHK